MLHSRTWFEAFFWYIYIETASEEFQQVIGLVMIETQWAKSSNISSLSVETRSSTLLSEFFLDCFARLSDPQWFVAALAAMPCYAPMAVIPEAWFAFEYMNVTGIAHESTLSESGPWCFALNTGVWLAAWMASQLWRLGSRKLWNVIKHHKIITVTETYKVLLTDRMSFSNAFKRLWHSLKASLQLPLLHWTCRGPGVDPGSSAPKRSTPFWKNTADLRWCLAWIVAMAWCTLMINLKVEPTLLSHALVFFNWFAGISFFM
jgi:hypothetical protein